MHKSTLKEKAYFFCQRYIEDRIGRIQNNISSIQEALSSETKSSAGDKHETGRAMLQLEREKLGAQLAEAETTKKILAKVNVNVKSNKVGLGSLVSTSKANYFISISAGEFKTSENSIFCISALTPIGRRLFGKSSTDHIFFNEEEIWISKIE